MRILIAAILSLFLFLLCNNPQKGGDGQTKLYENGEEE